MNLPNSSNPFVGLRPFESDESLLFFGRQDQTLELLQRLHRHHFVAVVGSSGSGKSSLIRAGLIPSLKGGYLVDERDKWIITIMKPGQSPLYNLADAILDQLNPVKDDWQVKGLLSNIREAGSDAILNVIQNLWEEKNTNFFLLIDQFEELFRFSMEQKEIGKRDDAIDFVNIILELSRQTDLPVYVVITMRSDFIGDCAQFFGLPEAMNQSQYLVPRLNRVQLKTAIEGPVKLYGGMITAALISRLLNDAGTVKDELPLLQHALMRVWEHEKDIDKNAKLDLRDYELIGGIEKTLSNHADEALNGMSDAELMLTKKIFQALTTIDENGRKIRRPVHIKELKEITGAGREQILAIINRFIENKRSFLVVNKAGELNDEVIDISHESLIRQWNTLNGWVDEEAESAKTYLRLSEAAKLYEEKKKDLLMGNELQQIIEWYYSFKPGMEWTKKYNNSCESNIGYLKKSEKAEKRRKNSRKMIVGGVIAAITVIAFILFFMYKSAQAATKREIAQKEDNQNQLATNYWNSSQDERAENKLAEALHFIAEGVSISKNGNLTKNMLLDIESFLPVCFLRSIVHHESAVNSAAFSRDGKRIVTASADGTVRIWDAISDKKIGKDIKQEGIVNNVVFSPDGTQVLTAGRDSTARLWDVSSGRQVGAGMRHRDAVNSAVFSPDGTKILTASDDSTARLWDAASGIQIGREMRHGDAVNSAVFSPDGTQMLTASDDFTARRWDTAGNVQSGRDMKHGYYVNSAVFSPDGTQILTAGADGTVLLWDATANMQIGPVIKHEDEVNSVAFSPDGRWILTASDDSTARLWDAASGRQIGPEMEHDDYVNNAVFSPDGTQMLTASRDSAVRIWDVAGNTQISPVMKHNSIILSAVFSPDSKRVLTAGADSIARLWYAGSGIRNGRDMKHGGILLSAVFSPDGKRVLTASADKTARIWDAASGKQIGKDMMHDRAILNAVFSSDGKWVLTACYDGTARLWDAESGKQAGRDMKHKDAVYSAVFSPDNKWILTASRDSTARLWDAKSGEQIGLAMKHGGAVNSAVFSPDGKQVLTASADKTARLWDAVSGKQIDPVMKHGSAVNSGVFSHDGKRVLTASADKTARIWDAVSKKQVGRDMMHKDTVYSAVFSPDDMQVLTASRDSTACLWDAASGKQIGLAMKQGGAVRSAVFNADGTQVLTAGRDSAARIWDEGTDLDIPGALFKLQARAATGYELNSETGKIEVIPYKEWYGLKEEYNKEAKEHYESCKYRKHNFWSHFNPEEKRKVAVNR